MKSEEQQMPDDLKLKLQELKEEFLEDVDTRLSQAFERLLDGQTNGCTKVSPKRKNSKEFREKVFVCRNSALTDLWSISHMRSAFNICTALFIVLIVNTGLYYAADRTQLWKDLDFVSWCFGNLQSWISILVLMHASVICGLYPAYKYWAFSRKPSPEISCYDVGFLILYILFQSFLFVVPVVLMIYSKMSPVANSIVMGEQARILMKSYAFFRENISRAINFKPNEEGQKDHPKEPCPEFQKFLYFLFAPTLVYRDNYPRTAKVHWEKVVWLFVQVLACILTPFMAFQRFVAEMFNRAGHEPFLLEVFILILSGCIAVGTIFMFCGFYGLLHCWMNAFAEMLRFGDRAFYSDWWNSTTYTKYYRTWNTIVHDWLYAYVYRDLIKVFRGNQNLSLLMVFLISAIMHEFIISFVLGFLYPILFLLMITFGVWVVHLTRGKTSDAWNVFLWWGVCCGWGIQFVLYSAEYYSRKNCPSFHDGVVDLVIPRSWTCNWLQVPFLGSTVNSTGSLL